MATARSLRRSELATPASSPKMLAKAPSTGADLVFIDLEDACAPDVKVAARAHAIEALTGQDWGSTIRAVRVNGLDTVWCADDVTEIVSEAGHALDVLIVPKVRRARDVWWYDVLLTQLEDRLGLGRRIALEALIEEAEGVANAVEIARASSRLEAIILGAGDLSASLQARVDTNFQPVRPYAGDFWHAARFQVVVAARTAGIQAIDAPHPAYQDPDGFVAAAESAAAMGFDGKWAIHPSQVALANSVFDPTPEEVAWAEETKAAYREAQDRGVGAIGRDGMLVDAAHMRHVETVLSRRPTPTP